MKGLIFNLLADLARRAGCEEDAWHVALSVSEEVSEEMALDEECEELEELLSEATLQGGADFTFRWLLRSGSPFREEDWADTDELGAHQSSLRGSRPPEAFGLGMDPISPLYRRRSDKH